MCNKFLNRYTAIKNPKNVVLNKKICNLLNGMQTSSTASILTNPINKYIIVTSEFCAIPSTGAKNVKTIILRVITNANGIAFRKTVCRKIP